MALSHLRNLLPALALPAERVDLGELVVPYINILLHGRKAMAIPQDGFEGSGVRLAFSI